MPQAERLAPDISIVIPSLNEAANLPMLLARIDRALPRQRYEVLIVDDGSNDGTPEVCQQLATRYPLVFCPREKPADGLSGAVLHGLARAKGHYFVVMDADLQHPPERIPDLLAPLTSGEAEFVLGSRYVPGGSTDQRWGFLRQANSWLATLLARPFAGRTRDPMSGFFALERSTYQRATRLNPVGYKIALELMCKCKARRVREIPIHFGLREAGTSKLNLTQQVRYLDHLSRLYDFCFPRASPWIKFIIATACAWLAAFSVYARLVAHDVNPFMAPTLAFAASAALTAVFHRRTLRCQGRPLCSRRDWLDFALVITGEWSICILSARWLATHIEHLTAVQFFAIPFSAALIARITLRTKLLHSLRGVRPIPEVTEICPTPIVLRDAA